MSQLMRNREPAAHSRMLLVHANDPLVPFTQQHPRYVSIKVFSYHNDTESFSNQFGPNGRVHNAEVSKETLCGLIGPSHGLHSVACGQPSRALSQLPVPETPGAGCVTGRLG